MLKKYSVSAKKSYIRNIGTKITWDIEQTENKMEDANITTWIATLSDSELNNVFKMQSLWNWIKKNLAIYSLEMTHFRIKHPNKLKISGWETAIIRKLMWFYLCQINRLKQQ